MDFPTADEYPSPPPPRLTPTAVLINSGYMNTILPVFEKVRSFCVSKLSAHGLIRVRRRVRRIEVQLELPWR